MRKAVIAATGRVKVAIVGDRVHKTFTSGGMSETFAITFHEAEASARETLRLLGEHRPAAVVRMPKKNLGLHGG